MTLAGISVPARMVSTHCRKLRPMAKLESQVRGKFADPEFLCFEKYKIIMRHADIVANSLLDNQIKIKLLTIQTNRNKPA